MVLGKSSVNWLKKQLQMYLSSIKTKVAIKNHNFFFLTKNQFGTESVNVYKYSQHGVLRKLKHIFPNTYQRIKSIRSPAKGGTDCYRFNYQPGSFFFFFLLNGNTEQAQCALSRVCIP